MWLKACMLCDAVDPFQRELATEYIGKPERHQFSFLVQDVGPHVVDLRCGNDTVIGGPFTCNVYDAMRVKVLGLPEFAEIGDEIDFAGIRTYKHVYNIFT